MPRRTLIVEDDPQSARALLSLVRTLGNEAQAVARVAEALLKLDEFDPECVLLDHELPRGAASKCLKRSARKTAQ